MKIFRYIDTLTINYDVDTLTKVVIMPLQTTQIQIQWCQIIKAKMSMSFKSQNSFWGWHLEKYFWLTYKDNDSIWIFKKLPNDATILFSLMQSLLSKQSLIIFVVFQIFYCDSSITFFQVLITKFSDGVKSKHREAQTSQEFKSIFYIFSREHTVFLTFFVFTTPFRLQNAYQMQ